MPGMRYLEVSRRYVSRWPDPAPDSACMPISLLGQTLLVSLGFARVSGFSMVVIKISTANLQFSAYLSTKYTVHLGVGLLIFCGYCAHGRGQTNSEDGTKSPPHYLWLNSRRAQTFQ